MVFPTDLTEAVDNTTDVLAAHLNNLEAKVGIDDSAVTTSLDYRSKVLLPTHSLTRQALDNSNFDIWQRATGFTSASVPANDNDTWITDRWLLLSDGDDIVDIVHGATGLPDGSNGTFLFQVETADKRFALCQILENKDAIKLDNKTVSLSFLAKTVGTEIANIRAAVISWDDTADVVTSNLISNWQSAGTDPTLAANWTYENTPSNLALTDSFVRYKIEGIAIDTASMANLAVLIWVDDDDCAINDRLYLSQVQLNEGAIALPYQPKSYAEELSRCQRRCFGITTTAVSEIIGVGSGHDANTAIIYVPFPTTMAKLPTLTATPGDWILYKGAVSMGDVSALAIANNFSGINGVSLSTDVASGLTAGEAYSLNGDGTTGRKLLLDAEL